MKCKTIFAALLALVLPWTGARAQSAYGWDATTNEALFATLLTYCKTTQADLMGTPAYYLAQNLMLEMEATHDASPYLWMKQVHAYCNQMESMFPAELFNPMVGSKDPYEKLRRSIMRLRDFPMHEAGIGGDASYTNAQQTAAFSAANKQWLQYKRDDFFQFLAKPRPTGKELQIAKLYSSGFVMRTKNACIGMDICYEEGLYSSDRVNELTDMLDVLYVTHAHGDHYDLGLIRRMLSLGKPVVMTKDLVGGTYPGTKYVWSNGQNTPIPIGPTQSLGFMSAQGTEPCLLYMVEIDDWRIIHVGDNSFHDNEGAYTNIEIADIVISPVFQGITTLLKYTKGAPNPSNREQIYINCHENEWHHSIDHRVSFKYMYTNAASLGNTSFIYPSCIIMDCGEHIVLNK